MGELSLPADRMRMPLSDNVIKSEYVKIVSTTASGSALKMGNMTWERKADASHSDQQATLEKQRLVEKEKEKEQLKKAAYQKGHADGVEWQKQKAHVPINALTEALKETTKLQKRIYGDAEEQMVALVLAIAEKVIYEEAASNNKIILSVLRAAIKSTIERQDIIIRLNPGDYRYIREMHPGFLQEIEGVRNATFEEDVSIKQGGALLETTSGQIDARLEQRIKEVKAALTIT